MEEDAYGIPKPKDTELVVPTLLFVPCVGYGAGGYRLGYGGGFYDRTLAALEPRPFTVGLGFTHGFLEDFEPEAHDLPLDKGPGNYLTFVPQYFKNRTWGVEVIDNSRVPGVTKPTLTVNQYTTVDFLKGGVAFFRAIDRPGVTGYGWMAPGELVDRDVAVCKPTPYPANGKLATATRLLSMISTPQVRFLKYCGTKVR